MTTETKTKTTAKATKSSSVATRICCLSVPYHFNDTFKAWCKTELGCLPTYASGSNWDVWGRAGDISVIEKVKQFARKHSLDMDYNGIDKKALDACLAWTESQPPSMRDDLLAHASRKLENARAKIEELEIRRRQDAATISSLEAKLRSAEVINAN